MSLAISTPKQHAVPDASAASLQANASSGPGSGPPVVGQHAFERWSDVPPEILIQLMAWTSRFENSLVSARSLGCVSKRFDAAMKAFPDIDLHRQTTKWIRSCLAPILSSDAFNPRWDFPDCREWLKAALSAATKAASVSVASCSPIWLEKMLNAPDKEDLIGEFRAYGGQTLAIATFGGSEVGNLILKVERALPAGVSLSVQIMQLFAASDRIDDAWMASFISRLCAGGRPMAFSFSSIGFVNYPLATKALMDALCGQGYVMSVSFDDIGEAGPDCLLQELTDRFEQLAHVQLISIVNSYGNLRLSYSRIEDLQVAMEGRRDARASRVNVAIDFKLWDHPGVKGKPLASEDKRRQVEDAGLYFGKANGSSGGSDIVARISASTGNDFWPTPVRVQPADECSDSDSIIASSSDDEVDGEEISASLPAPAQQASEPRMKKRDRCVVS